MPTSPPLRSADELDAASADTIARHIAWELGRLIRANKSSQLNVASAIGYQASSGALSRIINGRASLPLERAHALDQAYPEFTLALDGQTFATLRERQELYERDTAPAPSRYDVFIASPMASARSADAVVDAYGAERSAAMELAEAFEQFCGFRSIYYAGKTIETPEAFESPVLSIEANAEALYRSRFFVLFALEAPSRPSGVYVEAGLALAWRKPSVYFVPDTSATLPWMLRTIGEHESALLPRVSIVPVASLKAAVGTLRQHRAGLLTRLER